MTTMFVANLKQTFAQLGFFNGLLYLLSRILEKLTRNRARIVRYHLVAQPIPTTSPHRQNSRTQTAVRIVSVDDPIVRSFPRPAEVIARRFAEGATCFVAEMKGRFAGFIWIARNHYDEDEVRCRYVLAQPATCVWDFDVYVEPEFRAGRCFSRLWDAVNQELNLEGFLWTLSRISAFNPGSLAAHRRLGLHPLSSATFFIFGPIQLMLIPSLLTLKLSFNSNSPPKISLDLAKHMVFTANRSNQESTP